MQTIVNNLLINYSRNGTGSCVLLLHGWGQNKETFAPVIKELSKTHEIIAIDFPGFGKSQLPDGDWTVGDYVDLLSSFLQKINCQPTVLIGHSFGGRVIIKGVGLNKLSAKKLVLIGAAGIEPRKTHKQAIIGAAATVSSKIPLLSPLRRRVGARFASADYVASGNLRGTFLNVINEDLQQCAKNITQPTLLIWGENDAETPLSDGKTLHQLVRHSTLKSYEGAGHFVYLEKTDEVIHDIGEFIE